jgi:glycosyltransferase involved in cell wall biosynthesis
MNWVAPEDLDSFSRISGWELLTDEQKVLIPIALPFLSTWVNRFIAPLPVIRAACLLRIAVLRRKMDRWEGRQPSVSVLIPARNEAGNIRAALERVPLLSPADELIFVEGNSTDDTWETIVTLTRTEKYQAKWGGRIRIAQQDGKGKGDAVRKGFGLASGDILLILDADLTVAPEDLPKFYRALVEDAGEFVNGSRLVYPLEKRAMRFFNIIGNKFFAVAFSYVLGVRFKDTLCGTKVLSRSHYQKLAAHREYFGDFDPFGDFDLIFGARRMGLRMAEVPIRYRERTYGYTNIQRWRHGVILLRMLLFAAGKLRFT